MYPTQTFQTAQVFCSMRLRSEAQDRASPQTPLMDRDSSIQTSSVRNAKKYEKKDDGAETKKDKKEKKDKNNGKNKGKKDKGKSNRKESEEGDDQPSKRKRESGGSKKPKKTKH